MFYRKLRYLLIILVIFVDILSATDLEKISLQLKWKYQFQFAGFIAAKEKGFYRDVGYDVRLIEFDASKNIIDEVKRGKIEFGVSDSSLVLERMRGEPIVAMMVVFQESPFVLLTLKSSNIKKIKDINGKKIALDEKHYGVAIKAMLKSNQIEYTKQPVIHTLDNIIDKKSDMMSAYLSNEPFIAKEKGFETVIFDPKDYGFAGYGDILFCSEEMIKENPEMVQKFYEASFKGWEYTFSHMNEMVDLIYKKYNSLNKSKKALRYEAEVLKELSGYGDNFGKFNKEKIKAISQMFNLMIEGKHNFDYLNDFIYTPTRKSERNFTKKELHYLKKKKTIKICFNSNYPPIMMLDRGKYVGVPIDFLELISKKFNLKYEIVESRNWKDYFGMLKNRQCDTTAISLTKPNSYNFLTPTKPYVTGNFLLTTKINEPYVHNLNMLKDKKIGILKGDKSVIEYVKTLYPNIILVEMESYDFQQVIKNKLYGIIGRSLEMSHIISAHYSNKLKIMSKVGEEKVGGSFGVSNREPILLNILNRAIDNLSIQDKQLIMSRWYRVEVEKQIDYNLIKHIVVWFLIILSMITLWLVMLRRNNQKIKEFNSNLEKQVKEEVEKNRQQQLLMFQQSRLAQMGEMLSMIAHQWRQPLSGINAVVMLMDMKISKQNIEDRLFLEEEFTDIESLTKHMSNTIDDFRDFFKPERERVKFNLQETIEHTIGLIRPVLSHGEITINTDYQENIELLGYPNEFGQVILNIITNAKDVLISNNQTKEKNIHIQLSQKDKTIIVTIQDNAGGINHEIINRVFDPYFSTKLKKSGTGLGLYISKMIIEEHMGGELSVKNSSDGAIFRIEFNNS